MGGVFNNTEIASGVLSFGIFPLVMLSGAMLPLYILPDAFDTISYLIPFTYLTELFHEVLFDLDGKLSVFGNTIVLVIISAVFFFLTKWTFRWT